MGREIKRVALDFSWPLQKVWKGYKNDRPCLAENCSMCHGDGWSDAARTLHKQWYGQIPFTPKNPFAPDLPEIVYYATRNVERSPSTYTSIQAEAQRLCDLFNGAWSHHLDQDDVQALIDNERLMFFTHRPRTQEQAESLKSEYFMKESNGYTPTADEVNRWSLNGFGHDGINSGTCVCAKLKRLGLGDPHCSKCDGHGTIWPSEEAKKFYDEWERSEPPTGDGWQLWETVSSGSPVSPVKRTREDLALWLSHHSHLDGVDELSYDRWLAFIDVGWCPSAIGIGGKLVKGVEAVSIG